ncbi:hypothetical protein HanRHA438_Chr06g0266101 [Helianthus annuus]|nr:hypothetical protein HanRHA438_Chr06g0266101 [Helianthus annuus]
MLLGCNFFDLPTPNTSVSFNQHIHNLSMYRTARNRRPKTTSSETNQITDQDSDSLESTMGNIRMMILSTICNEGEGDLLTPEKRLLNSIEIVERVVMEELNRLKRTPAAEKAEREKKVRTLMSMR